MGGGPTRTRKGRVLGGEACIWVSSHCRAKPFSVSQKTLLLSDFQLWTGGRGDLCQRDVCLFELWMRVAVLLRPWLQEPHWSLWMGQMAANHTLPLCSALKTRRFLLEPGALQTAELPRRSLPHRTAEASPIRRSHRCPARVWRHFAGCGFCQFLFCGCSFQLCRCVQLFGRPSCLALCR